MRKKSALFFIVAFLIFSFSVFYPNNILALENTPKLTKQIINPDSFYYPLKRVFEKVQERFVFSKEAKINLYNSLLNIRLSELNNMVMGKKLGEIQKSSERLIVYAWILTDLVSDANDKQLKKDVSHLFAQIIKILENLRDQYQANSSYWLLIQHDINSLKIYSEKMLLKK